MSQGPCVPENSKVTYTSELEILAIRQYFDNSVQVQIFKRLNFHGFKVEIPIITDPIVLLRFSANATPIYSFWSWIL
jgi:hypothetical protein